MNEHDMLSNLNEHGEDAGSDYNDGLDGYFGWTVDQTGATPVLTVTFQSLAPNSQQLGVQVATDHKPPVHERRWELLPQAHRLISEPHGTLHPARCWCGATASVVDHEAAEVWMALHRYWPNEHPAELATRAQRANRRPDEFTGKDEGDGS